jgi:hypothetical protein
MSGDRSAAHRRRGEPPPDSVFDAPAPAAGDRHAALALSGLVVAFDRMDEPWHRAFLGWFGSHAADRPDSGEATLRFSAGRSDAPHFIAPPPAGRIEYNPVFVESRPDGESHFRVRVCTYGQAARFSTAGGDGEILFSRAAFDPRERGVENILRVTLAWLTATRGGMLLHSASIEKDGRAFLFFGQSGAGKSTLASLSRRGRVISDDLTLLLPGRDGGLEAIGSPFRGTYTQGEPVHGRFPLAAAFRLRKAAEDETARVEPLPPAQALPDAFANLPFVVDQLHRSPKLFASIERSLKSIPMYLLRFTRHDDSFWDVIEAAGV